MFAQLLLLVVGARAVTIPAGTEYTLAFAAYSDDTFTTVVEIAPGVMSIELMGEVVIGGADSQSGGAGGMAGGSIDVEEDTFVLIENANDAFVEYVFTFNGNPPFFIGGVGKGVVGVPDDNFQIVSFTASSITLRTIQSPPPAPELQGTVFFELDTLPGISHDPHVHTADGHLVDIYLPVGEWTNLLAGDSVELLGRVFSRANDPTTQWFDSLKIVDKTTGDDLFFVSIPRDVALGEVGPELQYVRATLGNETLTRTNAVYTSGTVQVETMKLDGAIRGGRNPIYNDALTVKTLDFDAYIEVSRETKRENYDSLEEQLAETHLNLRFSHVPAALTGPLAEIIWPTTNLSAAAKRMTSKDNAFA